MRPVSVSPSLLLTVLTGVAAAAVSRLDLPRNSAGHDVHLAAAAVRGGDDDRVGVGGELWRRLGLGVVRRGRPKLSLVRDILTMKMGSDQLK